MGQTACFPHLFFSSYPSFAFYDNSCLNCFKCGQFLRARSALFNHAPRCRKSNALWVRTYSWEFDVLRDRAKASTSPPPNSPSPPPALGVSGRARPPSPNDNLLFSYDNGFWLCNIFGHAQADLHTQSTPDHAVSRSPPPAARHAVLP